MQDQLAPTVDKIQGVVAGFFWILPNIGIGFAIFLLFLLAAWAIGRTVAALLRRRGRANLGELLGGFCRWAVILFGLLVFATIVFPSIKPADLLATLGIGSVAIGFAFKDILQNWMSGLLILFRQPFRVGDEIVSGSFEGRVEGIEARATMLRTYDGQRVVIPNTDIYTGAVVVRTAFAASRSEYDVGIGYGDDIQTACAIILRTLAEVEGVEPEPAPEALPWALDASTINIRVRWWSGSRRREVVATRGRVILAVKRAFDAAGIDMPFPTQVMLFHDQTEDADGNRTRQREGWPSGGKRVEARGHVQDARA